MAIIFEAAYSKKLGLPNYSSHSYVASVRVELQDISRVPEESQRLYKMLQEAVDSDIQQVGFLPDATTYGMNGEHRNGDRPNGDHRNGEPSGISEKQLDLIGKIVNENNVNKADVEALSVQLFGNGVRALNRLHASNLIDELFEKYGRGNGNGRKPFRREYANDRRS